MLCVVTGCPCRYPRDLLCCLSFPLDDCRNFGFVAIAPGLVCVLSLHGCNLGVLGNVGVYWFPFCVENLRDRCCILSFHVECSQGVDAPCCDDQRVSRSYRGAVSVGLHFCLQRCPSAAFQVFDARFDVRCWAGEYDHRSCLVSLS